MMKRPSQTLPISQHLINNLWLRYWQAVLLMILVNTLHPQEIEASDTKSIFPTSFTYACILFFRIML